MKKNEAYNHRLLPLKALQLNSYHSKQAMKVTLRFTFYFLIILLSTPLSVSPTAQHSPPQSSTILFASHGSRSIYAFDIFTLPTAVKSGSLTPFNEQRLTDGKSFNFNGHFPSPVSSASLLSLLPNETLIQYPQNSASSIVYATERGGSSNIYFDLVNYDSGRRRTSRRVQVPLLRGEIVGVSFKDKPTLVGDSVVFISTHEDPKMPRQSWTAVYSTELRTGVTRRLTPLGIADYSPAVSPSGVFTAVASYGERRWNGEVEELSTDIYVFLTHDGTHRVKIVEHGGWPSWVDDSTLYFHRRNDEDGWISVYRAIVTSYDSLSIDSVTVERVTPLGIHAFTPAASPGNNKFIAVATRRPNSEYRHIELFDLVKNEFIELTRLVSPQAHHFNPFISPDSARVGYHRCRGASSIKKSSTLFMLENLKSPLPEVSLFRIDGTFPSWSPRGDRLAFVGHSEVYVVNVDGSNRRTVYSEFAFPTVWDPVRPGIIYISTGPPFANESRQVDIVSINVDEGCGFKKLTTNAQNNAFPSISPDGKWIVFRSGRSGHKNLYIMDAVKGEKGGLFRLTEGPWSDTMCNWSPDGEWIVFCSDREDPNPNFENFELFLIHPNGTGLRKLFKSGFGGRVNHPYFSPDGKSIVFTSDYAGISAEPISTPRNPQPYGEIFSIKLDGSDLKRLTHNSVVDGTPAWGPYIEQVDRAWPKHGPRPQCSFSDRGWTWINQTTSHMVLDELLVSKQARSKRCLN